MRKLKAADQKAKSLTITTPFSKVKTDIGASALYNRTVAEFILGEEPNEFWKLYHNPLTDTRYKRDPWTQEFIRCARWMVESVVKKAWYLEDSAGTPHTIILEVFWHKTKVHNYVVVDLSSRQFHHVIYDSELFVFHDSELLVYEPEGAKNPDIEEMLRDATPYVWEFSHANTFKHRIINRWIRVSCDADAKGLGLEITRV